MLADESLSSERSIQFKDILIECFQTENDLLLNVFLSVF